MGREWYWVGGKSSKTRGTGVHKENTGTTPGCMCSVFQLFDFHQFQLPSHQQQPSLNLDSLLLEEPSISKGAEAPRNSLELDEPPFATTTIKEEEEEEEDESLHIPMAIQIKTNGYSKAHGAPNDSSSSEITSSPSTKTPTLVARLMGLDLLPGHQTYSPILETPNTLSKSHVRRRYTHQSTHEFSGTRSLPETPRISSARRSDVEHRLSLQINKENISPSEELVLSRISSLKRKELKTEEENRSPGHYARQIVKQVKQSVSRKVGLDITNTVRSRDHYELVNQLKTKKIMSKVLNRVGDDSISPAPGKNSTASASASASCSPRLKFLEPRNNKQVSTTTTVLQSVKDHNIVSQSLKPSISATSLQVLQKTKAPTKPKLQEQVQQENQRAMKKCKKVDEERFGPPPRLKKPPQTSDIIRNKQEEPFVRQATVTRTNIPDKKTPLSNDLLNITVPTLLLPVKKDPSTPRATKVPQKQAASKRSSQLSSCSSPSYEQQQVMHTTLNARGTTNNEDRFNSAAATTTTTGEKETGLEEYEYISRILKRTGIDKDTPVSFTRWFSPSHPLDPSIFHYLEYFTTISPFTFTNSNNTAQLTHRCNRKLLFHLVDEILVDILKPYLNIKPWVERFDFSTTITISNNSIQGSELVNMLCSRIRRFPCADCRVLEDIDALVDKDMPLLNDVAFGEEGEGIVTELEKDLLDTLIHETAVIFYGEFL